LKNWHNENEVLQMKNPEETTLHWSQHKEHAAGYWQLKILIVLFRYFPLIILRIIAFPVGFMYFLFSKSGRTESSRFLKKIAPLIEDPLLAKQCRSHFGPLRHIVSFALSIVEKIQSWGGKFSLNNIYFQDDDIGELNRRLEEGKGAFILFSHLGSTMLLMGLLNSGRTGVSRKIQVTTILDMKVSAHFTRMLNELNPRSSLDIIAADEVGSHTAVLLEERIAAGGLVLVTGDRTSAGGRNFIKPFMGKDAPFPFGIFYLATMMNAPVYCLFGLRRKTLSIRPTYAIHVHKSPLTFDCPRKERFRRCSLLVEYFTTLLTQYCKEQPFQWYNFFDFWQEPRTEVQGTKVPLYKERNRTE
jgi:predicted LPLAT superfamily acyltransferase